VKILALEIEVEGVKPEQFQPYLKEEAQLVWELYQSGAIRELYFRADRSDAVLMLECADLSEARQTLQSLPLVQAGLITFDIVPLVPYPGFARLFRE
jgi:muconolactone delta-isomerase